MSRMDASHTLIVLNALNRNGMPVGKSEIRFYQLNWSLERGRKVGDGGRLSTFEYAN